MKIPVDTNMRELFEYSDLSFPFIICIDNYELFDNNVLNLHWHDFVEYGLVLSGSVEFAIGETTIIVDEGEGIYINSNSLHTAKKLVFREIPKYL